MLDHNNKSRHDLLFSVRRSIRYHDRRLNFYEVMHRLVLLSALILSSASIAAFAAEFAAHWSQWVKLLPPALVSILTGADLVIGTTSKARLHDHLKRRFIDLECQIEQAGNEYDESTVAEWTNSRLRIEAEEPPILRVLDILCHNEQVRAMGYPKGEEYIVGFWSRLLAPLWDMGEHTIQQKTT